MGNVGILLEKVPYTYRSERLQQIWAPSIVSDFENGVLCWFRIGSE